MWQRRLRRLLVLLLLHVVEACAKFLWCAFTSASGQRSNATSPRSRERPVHHDKSGFFVFDSIFPTFHFNETANTAAMVVLTQVPGLNVHVTVNGRSLPEYKDDAVKEHAKSATSYVEAPAGAEFTINSASTRLSDRTKQWAQKFTSMVTVRS
ncbi:hypothetical protein CC86DRAFT_376939 [Ophiobolus disseminans]|uniref:DUF7918 domain-containing protein n=1 Tax=Ophiobolus disseminans TaxID=1469910 RepID=A0A6A7AMZ6_9PLEO|nr:hypothetical protein CC86DRAFT_376939 [Ophiobolus disseminans]